MPSWSFRTALASSEILVQSISVHQVAQRHQGKVQKEGWATAFRGHKFSPTSRCLCRSGTALGPCTHCRHRGAFGLTTEVAEDDGESWEIDSNRRGRKSLPLGIFLASDSEVCPGARWKSSFPYFPGCAQSWRLVVGAVLWWVVATTGDILPDSRSRCHHSRGHQRV